MFTFRFQSACLVIPCYLGSKNGPVVRYLDGPVVRYVSGWPSGEVSAWPSGEVCVWMAQC